MYYNISLYPQLLNIRDIVLQLGNVHAQALTEFAHSIQVSTLRVVHSHSTLSKQCANITLIQEGIDCYIILEELVIVSN